MFIVMFATIEIDLITLQKPAEFMPLELNLELACPHHNMVHY